MRTKCFADRLGIIPHFAFQQSHGDKCVDFSYVQRDHKTAPALPSAFPVQAHALGSRAWARTEFIHVFLALLVHEKAPVRHWRAIDKNLMARALRHWFFLGRR